MVKWHLFRKDECGQKVFAVGFLRLFGLGNLTEGMSPEKTVRFLRLIGEETAGLLTTSGGFLVRNEGQSLLIAFPQLDKPAWCEKVLCTGLDLIEKLKAIRLESESARMIVSLAMCMGSCIYEERGGTILRLFGSPVSCAIGLSDAYSPKEDCMLVDKSMASTTKLDSVEIRPGILSITRKYDIQRNDER